MNGLGPGSEETQEAHGARAAVIRPRPRPRVHQQPLKQKEPYFQGTFLPSPQTIPWALSREQQPSPRNPGQHISLTFRCLAPASV